MLVWCRLSNGLGLLTCGHVLALPTGITHVLNVVGGRYPSDIPKDQFEIIPLSDYGTDKLDKKLTPCFEFLRTQHQPLCARVCAVLHVRVRAVIVCACG